LRPAWCCRSKESSSTVCASRSAGSTLTVLGAGRRDTRQRGHVVFLESQWSMQWMWKVWPHGGILWSRSSAW
jgi:hypothetical protein